MASERCGSPHGAHAATTRRHGARVGRAPKQEHCGRSWHQSAYGREPPRLDHEEDRVEVVARVGEIGVSCLGWRRRAATGALRLWLLDRSPWRPAPSCFASVHLIDHFFWKALMEFVVQTLEVEPIRGLEVALDHAASTAFQISGAVLCLTRSLSSLN